MIRVKVDTSGLKLAIKKLDAGAKQVKFATMRALNAAAYKAKVETEKEIARVFDRPTPWIRRSVRYVKATRDNLVAQVDFDAWGNKQAVTASKVLAAEIYGGERSLKRFEKSLQARGILPQGMAIVPSKRVARDAYGNISPGVITQVLSFFDAFGEQGYRANSYAKGRARRWKGTKKTMGHEFFALQRQEGKLTPGIYMRMNYTEAAQARVSHLAYGGAFCIMRFVPIPKYRRRLDFYRIAEVAAVKEFNEQFPKLLDEAIRTAR